MKKYALPLVLILVLLDQGAKYLAHTFLAQGPVVLIEYWATLQYAQNPGMAFSLPINTILVILLAFGVVGYLGWQIRTKNLLKYEVLAYTLIMSGALGNVIDRITNDGKVIDFIALGDFPIFNLADSWITIGVAVYVWGEVVRSKKVASNL